MTIVARLLLLFTLLPIIEISLLIPLHDAMGSAATVGLVCVTAILGTALTKWQGSAALRRIKEAIGSGKLPGEEIVDGVLVLMAGVTLITPGVLTDTTGLLLLVPFVRAPVRKYAMKRVTAWMENKTTSYVVGGSSSSFGGSPFGGGGRDDVIDITPEEGASERVHEPEVVVQNR